MGPGEHFGWGEGASDCCSETKSGVALFEQQNLSASCISLEGRNILKSHTNKNNEKNIYNNITVT